ncbi:MAG: hypothetical protein F6K17_23650 [Okeania sp. SIO3C4]|nr:hypothetical protein [Okeania sp. SIO3C4]
MVEGRQKAEGRRQKVFSHCHLNFIHAPMLPDMISEVRSQKLTHPYCSQEGK